MLLATVREHQERAALNLEIISSYETSRSANRSSNAAECYLDQLALDKDINLRLEAEHAAQRHQIDVLEKEKAHALRHYLLEQEKRGLELDVLKERNQSLEADKEIHLRL